jgi:hypothetical protein
MEITLFLTRIKRKRGWKGVGSVKHWRSEHWKYLKNNDKDLGHCRFGCVRVIWGRDRPRRDNFGPCHDSVNLARAWPEIFHRRSPWLGHSATVSLVPRSSLTVSLPYVVTMHWQCNLRPQIASRTAVPINSPTIHGEVLTTSPVSSVEAKIHEILSTSPKLVVHGESVALCDRIASTWPPNSTRARRDTVFPLLRHRRARILLAPWTAVPMSAPALLDHVLAPMHARDTHRLNPLCLTTLNQPERLHLFSVYTVAVVGLS